MMYPLIVSDLPIEDLLEALEESTGTGFARLPAGQQSVNISAGEPLLAGEIDGRSCLVDLGAATIACLWSHLAQVASDRHCLVVTTSHDRAESQCELFAAQDGRIVRMFWSNPQRTTREFSVGDPLGTEAGAPLCNANGSGLTAALRSFGFHQMDYTSGYTRAAGDFVVAWPGDPLELLRQDDLHQQVGDHVRRNMNPDYEPPVPRVRVRRMES